jgi:hypothetical protein
MCPHIIKFLAAPVHIRNYRPQPGGEDNGLGCRLGVCTVNSATSKVDKELSVSYTSSQLMSRGERHMEQTGPEEHSVSVRHIAARCKLANLFLASECTFTPPLVFLALASQGTFAPPPLIPASECTITPPLLFLASDGTLRLPLSLPANACHSLLWKTGTLERFCVQIVRLALKAGAENYPWNRPTQGGMAKTAAQHSHAIPALASINRVPAGQNF